jgi:hypothetical protein
MTQPQPPTPGTRALQAVVQANIQLERETHRFDEIFLTQ